MNLGDLEFKEEDFTEEIVERFDCDTVRIANHILRERLAKAPEVFANPEISAWGDQDKHDTHRARLVCIEEMK